MEMIGILPAAGFGARLRSLRYPKELLPVMATLRSSREAPEPRPVLEYSLRAMCAAGVRRCLVVVSDPKLELIRWFGDGSDVGARLAYLHQRHPHGLADAVDAAHEWTGDALSCLALPDTIFRPFDAIARIRDRLVDSGADLVLGVFPTRRPEQFGPVKIGAGGAVLEVLDKPRTTTIKNTWAIAVWSPVFASFLHRTLRGVANRRMPLGRIFDRAARRGLRVQALRLARGRFADLGTPAGLAEFIARWGPINYSTRSDPRQERPRCRDGI